MMNGRSPNIEEIKRKNEENISFSQTYIKKTPHILGTRQQLQKMLLTLAKYKQSQNISNNSFIMSRIGLCGSNPKIMKYLGLNLYFPALAQVFDRLSRSAIILLHLWIGLIPNTEDFSTHGQSQSSAQSGDCQGLDIHAPKDLGLLRRHGEGPTGSAQVTFDP